MLIFFDWALFYVDGLSFLGPVLFNIFSHFLCLSKGLPLLHSIFSGDLLEPSLPILFQHFVLFLFRSHNFLPILLYFLHLLLEFVVNLPGILDLSLIDKIQILLYFDLLR